MRSWFTAAALAALLLLGLATLLGLALSDGNAFPHTRPVDSRAATPARGAG